MCNFGFNAVRLSVVLPHGQLIIRKSAEQILNKIDTIWSIRELKKNISKPGIVSLTHLSYPCIHLLTASNCPLHSYSCLMNGEFMPEVWTAQLTTGFTEMPAACLFAGGLRRASHTHTAFISLGAGNLYGLGTCSGTDLGQSASGTMKRWIPWSTGKYTHPWVTAQTNIFHGKCI